jgi:hypothetical protein
MIAWCDQRAVLLESPVADEPVEQLEPASELGTAPPRTLTRVHGGGTKTSR